MTMPTSIKLAIAAVCGSITFFATILVAPVVVSPLYASQWILPGLTATIASFIGFKTLSDFIEKNFFQSNAEISVPKNKVDVTTKNLEREVLVEKARNVSEAFTSLSSNKNSLDLANEPTEAKPIIQSNDSNEMSNSMSMSMSLPSLDSELINAMVKDEPTSSPVMPSAREKSPIPQL